MLGGNMLVHFHILMTENRCWQIFTNFWFKCEGNKRFGGYIYFWIELKTADDIDPGKYQFQGKTEFIKKLVYLTHECFEETFMKKIKFLSTTVFDFI